MSLKLTIEDLIDKSAKDFEVAKAIKVDYAKYLQQLPNLFHNSGGKDFVVKHTKRVDELLIIIYRYILRVSFGSFIPMSSSLPIALVALGSYGREQLSVKSDIDLMLVYKDIDGYNIKPMLEKILLLAWDVGLKLGHRVHEVDELITVSREDITIKTSLIEGRLITGSKILWFEVEDKINKILEDNKEQFINDKIHELQTRHKKYPLSMGINLKESAGGLRDVHTLFWIFKAKYHIVNIKDMMDKLFNENEYKEYRIDIEFMYRVRNAIHLVSNKKGDTLQLETLVDLVKILDFKSKSLMSHEMALATKIIETQHTIYYLTQLFLYRSIKNYTCSNIDFELLKNNIKNIKSFFYKDNISKTINTLFYAKRLGEIIHPLKKVLYLAQLDGYHKYPVGIHSIQTLAVLENIKDYDIQKEFDTLNKDDKAILKLVALIHDAGKGRSKDHSIVGEDLFKVYAKSIGFNEELISTGAKLIRHHILMSETVYKKDIYSQQIILEFVSKLIDVKIIKMLYILTYADINSVDEKLYNSNLKFLLKELYIASSEATKEEELVKESVRKTKKVDAILKDDKYKELPPKLQKKILNIESNLLFIKFKKDDIIQIAKKAYEIQDSSYKIGLDNHITIKIIKNNELNLGYLLGKLSYLDMRDMGIYKLFDNNKYFVITYDYHVENENTDLDSIKKIIDKSFDMSKSISLTKPTILTKDITINCNHTDTLASLSINAKNQHGLFAYVSKILDDYEIEIQSAKIFTQKNRVQDLLLIEKNGNFCNNKELILNDLVKGEK